MTTHTAAQLIVALLITEMLAPSFGSTGGLGAIVICVLAILLIVPFLVPLGLVAESPATMDNDSSSKNWTALFAVSLAMAGIVCIVTYSEIQVASLGIPDNLAQLTIPIVLVCQIIGGVAALIFSNTIPHRAAIVATFAVFLGAMALLTFATRPEDGHFGTLVLCVGR